MASHIKQLNIKEYIKGALECNCLFNDGWLYTIPNITDYKLYVC